MGIRRRIGRIAALVAMAAATAAVSVTGVGSGVLPAGAQSTDPTGEFHAVTPTRILDTRTALGTPGGAGPMQGGWVYPVQIAGRGGVPAGGVSGVVLNVTAVDPTATGYLTVYPSGIGVPGISNVNFVPGQTVPNMVTVGVGNDGRVNLLNAVGATHVLFDVLGYYSAPNGTQGERFVSVGPNRLFDTRSTGPTWPADALIVDVTGTAGVPASGVTGVVMNVTAVDPTAYGWVAVSPANGAPPGASSLNFVPGQTVPNLVTVQVPSSGLVSFYNAAGRTHLIADVVGYYTTDVTTEAGRFIPMVPERYIDTRVIYSMWPYETWWLDVTPGGWIPSSYVDTIVMNVTATEPWAPGYFTVYPGYLCANPVASNVNFAAGQTSANQVISGFGSGGCSPWQLPGGTVAILNASDGDAHMIVDAFGYFTSPDFPATAAGAEAADAGARRAPAAEPDSGRAVLPGRDR